MQASYYSGLTCNCGLGTLIQATLSGFSLIAAWVCRLLYTPSNGTGLPFLTLCPHQEPIHTANLSELFGPYIFPYHINPHRGYFYPHLKDR